MEQQKTEDWAPEPENHLQMFTHLTVVQSIDEWFDNFEDKSLFKLHVLLFRSIILPIR